MSTSRQWFCNVLVNGLVLICGCLLLKCVIARVLAPIAFANSPDKFKGQVEVRQIVKESIALSACLPAILAVEWPLFFAICCNSDAYVAWKETKALRYDIIGAGSSGFPRHYMYMTSWMRRSGPSPIWNETADQLGHVSGSHVVSRKFWPVEHPLGPRCPLISPPGNAKGKLSALKLSFLGIGPFSQVVSDSRVCYQVGERNHPTPNLHGELGSIRKRLCQSRTSRVSVSPAWSMPTNLGSPSAVAFSGQTFALSFSVKT